MQHRFVKDLKVGELVEGVYLVRERSFDVARNGTSYISLELVDKTGKVDAKKWDASKELFDSFNVEDFVRVRGRVELYKNYPQFNIETLEKTPDTSIDISFYMPSVDKNIEGMWSLLLSEIDEIRNPYLKALLVNIFSDEKKVSSFKKAPAATDFHHPYLGGLLEHTLGCIELAKFVMSEYQDINRDLLICGVILHDIGKIEELSFRRSFYYTDKGRLLGHIVLGVSMVSKEIEKILGFPEDLKNLVLHIILSHHGEEAWGSPKKPMCIEAIAMHHIDNLDAKLNGFKQFVDTYNDPYSTWTKHSKMFREFLYKKPVSDIDEVETPVEDIL